MFAKLLKHEWKSSSRILGILSLAALGVGVLGAVVMRIITNLEMKPDSSDLLIAVLGMLLLFMFLALVAYVAGTGILLLYRFYKSKFTDEGYLTFTLPVTSHQIFLSSFLNIAAWTAISLLVMVVSMALIMLMGIDWDVLEMMDAMGEMQDFYEYSYGEMLGAGDVVLSMVSSVVSFFSGIVTPMACLTIGAVLAKKHKILAAFGISYGVSMVSGMISSILNAMTMLSVQEFDMTAAYIAEIGTQLILMVGGYFLSTYLMSKKLNLP